MGKPLLSRELAKESDPGAALPQRVAEILHEFNLIRSDGE
jgi:hypothetical protein